MPILIESEEQAKQFADRNDTPCPGAGVTLFSVTGAGFLALDLDHSSRCGGSVGGGVGASWGQHGYIGGVMGRAEMAALRDALDNWLDSFCECGAPRDKSGYCKACRKG